MKKIGIMSLYHDTVNYGGALQAYALCKVINQLGYECQQLDIDCFAECENLDYTPSKIKKLLQPLKPIYISLYKIRNHKSLKSKAKLRERWRKSFDNFNNNMVPHSSCQYTAKSISDAVCQYDAFIVGSDQVWNPTWFFQPFFLTFASSQIPKIAYAASISHSHLSDKVKRIYEKCLEDFDAISVREENAVELLSDISPVPVEHVLDPTLLLDKTEWNRIASKRVITQPYVFCYFLGEDSNMRNVAAQYAQEKGFLLVNIMHAAADYHENDLGYGDVQLEAPIPNDFLALIRDSEMVFTDSFHASVFSVLFKRQFFTFQRMGHKGMESRINSLLKMFQVEERFCNTEEKATMDYIQEQKNIDYSGQFNQYEESRKKSFDFLKRSLSEAGKKVSRNEAKSS